MVTHTQKKGGGGCKTHVNLSVGFGIKIKSKNISQQKKII